MPILLSEQGIIDSRSESTRSIFVLQANELKQVLQSISLEVCSLEPEHQDAALAALVPFAQKMAVVPVSGFRVGAVALGQSGRVYIGVNIELPGLPLNAHIHAEQCLITNLVLHVESSVKSVAVSAAPCGHCRQFMSELCCAEVGGSADEVSLRHRAQETMILMFGRDLQPHMLPDILPERFGPHSLLAAGQRLSLLLEPQFHGVDLAGPVPSQTAVPQSVLHKAVGQALQAARQSYTPYYRCPAGAAIIFSSTLTSTSPKGEWAVSDQELAAEGTQDSLAWSFAARSQVIHSGAQGLEEQAAGWAEGGTEHSQRTGTSPGVFNCAAGPCMESAAHNPGMLPLQAAIAAGVLSGSLKQFDQIKAAVLVECEGMSVQYGATSQITLAAISPTAFFARIPLCFGKPEIMPKLASSDPQELEELMK